MMENLRSAANNPVLKIILAVIILSFVLTGVGGYLVSASDYAAKVNGTEISRGQLEQAFQQERQQQQAQLGEQFAQLVSSEEGIKQLRMSALNNLINSVLLEQYANTLGISASDDQVINQIRQIPEFMIDGVFNNDRYKVILNNAGYSPEVFAEQTRRDLIQRQLLNAFISTSFVLPDEVQNAAQLLLQSRTVRLATLSLSAMQEKQAVSDDEIKAYYDKFQNSFISPQEIKVSYVEIDAQDFQGKVAISEEEIQQYYDKDIQRFTTPARGEYSMIRLEKADEANDILAQLQKGADFKTLTTEKSTDRLTAKNGGSLGWLEANSLPAELKSANLTEIGQLSEVIKTPQGFIVFRLDDYKPEVIKPLADVKDEVTKLARLDAESKAFFDLQQKASEAATSDNDSLASVADVTGKKIQTTDWVSKGQLPEGLNFQEVEYALFNGNLFDENGPSGANSDVIPVKGDRAFVVRVEGYRPEAVMPLEKVKQDVSEIVKRTKAEKALKAQANELIAALKEGKGEQALADANVKFAEPITLQRTSQTDPVITAIFTLPEPKDGKAQYTSAENRMGDIAIIQLDKVSAGDATAEQLKDIRNAYKDQVANASIESLLINLRSNADIEFKNID